MPYTIRAEIAASDTAGMFARDWFAVGINDASAEYQSEGEALAAARAAYAGPDVDGVECRFWAEPSTN